MSVTEVPPVTLNTPLVNAKVPGSTTFVKLNVAAAVEDAYVPSEALEMMTTHPVATLEVSTFPDIEQPEVEVLRETDPLPVPPAELNVIDEPTVVVDGEPETLRAA